MTDPHPKEEPEVVKSINLKVLLYGISVTMLVVVIICGALVAALYSMSSNYLDEKSKSAELQQTIYDLRRTIDFAKGRLYVLDNFLIGRQRDTVEMLVKKFLREKKKHSNKVILKEFEDWAFGLPYDNISIGGGSH